MSLPETSQIDDVVSHAAKGHIETLRVSQSPNITHPAYRGLVTMWGAVRDPSIKFYPKTINLVAECVMEAEWLCVEQYKAQGDNAS